MAVATRRRLGFAPLAERWQPIWQGQSRAEHCKNITVYVCLSACLSICIMSVCLSVCLYYWHFVFALTRLPVALWLCTTSTFWRPPLPICVLFRFNAPFSVRFDGRCAMSSAITGVNLSSGKYWNTVHVLCFTNSYQPAAGWNYCRCEKINLYIFEPNSKPHCVAQLNVCASLTDLLDNCPIVSSEVTSGDCGGIAGWSTVHPDISSDSSCLQ